MSEFLGIALEGWIVLVVVLPVFGIGAYVILRRAMKSQTSESRVVALAVFSTIGSYFMATGIIDLIETYLPAWMNNPFFYIIMGLVMVGSLVTIRGR